MNMFPYLRIASLNLLMQKRRTLLLGAAVATVTFLLLVLLSFVGGISRNLMDAALTISSGHVNIGGFYKVRADRAEAVVSDKAALIELVKRSVPEVDRIVDRGRGWGRVISPESSFNAGLVGVKQDDLDRMHALRLVNKAPPEEFRSFENGSGVILFQSQAERLAVNLGDTVTFITESSGGPTGTADLTVVGIAADLGFLSNFSVIVQQRVVSGLYRLAPDTTGAIHLFLKDIRNAGAVSERLRGVLTDAGYEVMEHDPQPFFAKFRRVLGENWKGQRLDITVWEDEVSFLFWIITSLQGLSIFLIGVLGMIIAVGIANTTWMTVRERTREMGTLRAIGMQKPQVMRLFLLESILLGALASLSGALVAALVVSALDRAGIAVTSQDLKAFLMSDTYRFVFSPQQIGVTIAAISSLTGLAAAYPAWRASRLAPVVALGHAS